METFEDIKTYICDMVAYCDVISDEDSSIKSKVAFTHLMGKVAKRVARKCNILEKELERNADTDR